jgi:hypothetical protein
MDEFELTRRILSETADDPAALERVRGRLHEAIGLEQQPGRSPGWRRILPIAAAIGWVIALVVALTVSNGRGAEVAAGRVGLRQLGRITSTQEELAPEPGQFFLIRSEELRLESFGGVVGVDVSFDRMVRLSISTWVASDGSAFRRERVLSWRFASEADRLAWIQDGEPGPEMDREYALPPDQSPIHDVAGLPADPDRLLELLRSGAIVERPPGDDQVFIVIGELLAQGVAPPDVRAALFEVAARLEGVRLDGEVEDPLERPGVGVSLDGPTYDTRLVFDPDSAQLLAIELYEPDPRGTEQLTSWTAAFPTTVVDEAPHLEG